MACSRLWCVSSPLIARRMSLTASLNSADGRVSIKRWEIAERTDGGKVELGRCNLILGLQCHGHKVTYVIRASYTSSAGASEYTRQYIPCSSFFVAASIGLRYSGSSEFSISDVARVTICWTRFSTVSAAFLAALFLKLVKWIDRQSTHRLVSGLGGHVCISHALSNGRF